jgi:hypothetical protein
VEVYKQKDWFYYHYVQKRMNLSDIQKLLKEKHGITISAQALYNWAKKHDLLKFRGKGRRLKPFQPGKRVISPMEKKMAEVRKQQRQRNKYKKNF